MSESLKDVVSSVKDAIITPVQEAFVYRAKSIFGSLIISRVYWNWNKIAYMLLSDDDVLKKIEFIKNQSLTIPLYHLRLLAYPTHIAYGFLYFSQYFSPLATLFSLGFLH